jgi:undecaprenyl-diphosphatase
MLENIINIDTKLFYFINTDLANSVTDVIMPMLTHTSSWIPLFAIFCLFQIWNAFKKKEYNGLLCVCAVLVGIIICDQISSSLIKSIVQRPRPCHTFTDVHLLVGCGSGKSFPSSHAANSMMAVTIIALFFRKHKYWLPFLSILVGISRIFVGVHYPCDVLVGWILGAGVGISIYFLMKYLYQIYKKKKMTSK